MAKPEDLLPLIKGSDLFLSLLAPETNESVLEWNAERGLMQLAMDKVVQARLCPTVDCLLGIRTTLAPN